MTQNIQGSIQSQLLTKAFVPAIVSWNRLEGHPRRDDFSRSLRVEVRDPMWMLCRQWQFGEFKGEDAGTAVKAKVQLTTARINRYAGRSGEAIGYQSQIPLETRVEHETMHFDLMTSAQMGIHWLKMLQNMGNYKDIYLAGYGFQDPPVGSEAEIQLRSDRKGWSTFHALKGRVVDGARLMRDILSVSNEHQLWLEGEVTNAVNRQKILNLAQAYVEWFQRLFSQPDDLEDPAWSDAYLEYQFACSAPADEIGSAQTVLVSEQYHHGRLDWYAFNIDSRPGAYLPDKPGAAIPLSRLVKEVPMSFIPTPIEYGGMPNVRWWEFEDRKTDFGNIRPSTSDLAILLLAEFGLIYGNDWSLVPYVVEVGSLVEIQGIVVTDVFGVRTFIRSATDTPNGERQRWGMYYLNSTQGDGVDTRLFLPPVIGKLQESPVIESVLLLRDEIANMVWGIEGTIPGVSKGGADGFEAATDLKNYLIGQTPPSSPVTLLDTGAEIRYQVGTSVPENWIPFIPVHKPGSNRQIRLQRAAMPRLISGVQHKPVEPRGAILRSGLDASPPQSYFIHEEEVPRAGVNVTRSFQRARWWDGKVYVWLGRRKQTGRGGGSSGLRFDQIVHSKTESS